MTRRRGFTTGRYPGIDNRFVICDVCGKKFRVKDTVRITDQYNLLNNMIVCRPDADRVNPQIKPIYIQEDLLARKDYVRPESTYMTYINQGDTLPSAPRNLTVNVDAYSDKLLLSWDGPSDVGNVTITGYRIYRADDPWTEIFLPIVDNTLNGGTMYLDTSADIDDSYIYVVAAVTNIGESPWSNYAYWNEVDVNYLVDSQRGWFITPSQNDFKIVLRQQDIQYVALSQDPSLLLSTSQFDVNIIL